MAKDSLITLGNTIKKLREKKGFSQEALAEEAGIHRTYMGRVERGKQNISILNLIKIAKALGIPSATLLQELK